MNACEVERAELFRACFHSDMGNFTHTYTYNIILDRIRIENMDFP